MTARRIRAASTEMRVLGIGGFHREAAAALLADGAIVAASQEQWFARDGSAASFARRAARSCLDRAGIAARDLDAIVFHDKPLRRFERVLATQLKAFPRSAGTFQRTMASWLGERLWVKARLAQEFGVAPERTAFVERLRAHAAAAFFHSPFDEAALLVLDDGEWATTLLARGRRDGESGSIETLAEIRHPHTLSGWLAAFTQHLGFEPGVEEDRVEALAALGEPRFEKEVAATLPARADWAFAIEPSFFRLSFDGERLGSPALARHLGPARRPGAPLRIDAGDARDADFAASVQRVLEARVLALARRLHELAPLDVICVAGGVARNRALIARLVADGPFAQVHVPAVVGEPATALGAALEYAASRKGGAPIEKAGHARFGDRIDGGASEAGARPLGGAAEACAVVADRLGRGETVAWVRGALELGPRSFANRVVLADARGAGARERLQDSLRQGESWLPCRIALPRERAADWLELPSRCESALRSGHVEVGARASLVEAAPSLVSPRGRSWPQLVDRSDEPELHALLAAVGERTGAPLLALTSFQLRGQSIVRTEGDAVEAFARSEVDLLVVEDRLYERAAAPSRRR